MQRAAAAAGATLLYAVVLYPLPAPDACVEPGIYYENYRRESSKVGYSLYSYKQHIAVSVCARAEEK